MFHMKHMYKTKPFLWFLPFFNILRVFNGVQTLVFEKEVLSMRRAGMRLFSIVLFDRWLNAEAPCGSTRFVFGICGNYRSIIYSFCFCVISRTFSLIQAYKICFNTHGITYFPCRIAFVRDECLTWNICELNIYLRRRPAIHCALIKYATNIRLPPSYV